MLFTNTRRAPSHENPIPASSCSRLANRPRRRSSRSIFFTIHWTLSSWHNLPRRIDLRNEIAGRQCYTIQIPDKHNTGVPVAEQQIGFCISVPVRDLHDLPNRVDAEDRW